MDLIVTKKDPVIKHVKIDIQNQFMAYIKDYIAKNKDIAGALRMANRTGMLINDV